MKRIYPDRPLTPSERDKRSYEKHRERRLAEDRAYYEEHKEEIRARQNSRVRQISRRNRDHGITQEEFDSKLNEQDGKCAVCKDTLIRPHIDHDHFCCSTQRSCGKCNRGLLCRNCNSFLGLAKESEEILQNAIEYLKKYKKVS